MMVVVISDALPCLRGQPWHLLVAGCDETPNANAGSRNEIASLDHEKFEVAHLRDAPRHA